MTEKEKRDAGLWYDANFDADLLAERARADEACHQLNQLPPSAAAEREAILRDLLGSLGEGVTILEPFYVDYGYNVRIGDGSFLNHGAYLMDGAPITIGSHVFIGPNFGAYVAQHPLVAEERNRGLEIALPITIGDDVWIGGDVKVMPGVTIGSGSVIGAGSLITRDVPSGVVAMGSPCRVVRPITDADRVC
ncbi:sugar O-acetyltransferase [Olsenella profusa]|uniref:Acetyltransferase n=1 Tax=Olsenella profusa TaxID=138595 RepID=A0ABS2F2Q5_9ACTN|nr:sugar O-acetyltransferase [Olsenella profusa]MBM6774828.1 sugar O-acetyltransferase [Olsenella profusa]